MKQGGSVCQAVSTAIMAALILFSFQNCSDTNFQKVGDRSLASSQGIVILQQPSGLGALVGQPFAMNVVAEGKGELSYQWYKSSSPIPGAQNSDLPFDILGPDDVAAYDVEVSDEAGNRVRSDLVELLKDFPVIAQHPQSQSVLSKQNVTFSVVALGASLSYQWMKDGQPVSGATSSSLNISSTGASDQASYSVVVSNSMGSVESELAALTVTLQKVVNTINLPAGNACGNFLCSCHDAGVGFVGSATKAKAICEYRGYTALVSFQTANGPGGVVQCHSPDGLSGCFTNAFAGNLICTSVTCEKFE